MAEMIERWALQRRDGRLAHALAFSGGESESKLEMAWKFAQLVTCERPDRAPCGECGPCHRALQHESESVLLIEPEKNTIKLESAHRVLEFLSLQKVGRARVVIIDQAHLLNVQTGNALLKVVEEPPPDTFFLLIVSEISQLLSTLRSRVQNIRFAPKNFVLDPELSELNDLARRFLSEAQSGRREVLEQVQAEAKDREVALQFVRLVQRQLRDWSIHHADASVDDWRATTDLWQSAFKVELDVLANVDRSLLFENFFRRIHSALG